MPPPLDSQGALVILFQGQRYPVTKESFLIGRSGHACDLQLNDPHVSRKHLLIERVNDQYFAVDTGSTDGTLFQGSRISRLALQHGYRLQVCMFELVFLFEPAAP
jgi:pSer/pThr/pTyr-binding forkhead associated (FHA) protein